MADWKKLAEKLTASLALTQPPIAIARAAEVPEGVPAFNGTVAAGCRFWQDAAEGAFATSTADHELWAIGVHTHHMASPSKQAQEELGAVLKVMADMTYVRPEDVEGIPVLETETKHVVYAPLADTPVDPEVVMIFAHSQQGLVLSEAAQQVDGGVAPAMGRPACAVVPQALNSGNAALSLGCCGARSYLDTLTDDVALWALPADKLEAYAERLEALAGANQMLGTFHELRRADVEAGKKPTLDESLSRLG